ncbi:MAG: hypothetical protein QOH81_821 [Sphingomonadales bacterium]|jgi:hypothetical protein|nr:hypothetical protein [Sphingomonadales bacterium]
MINRAMKVTSLLATAMLAIGYAAPAYAQATRTWVSGVGDDVNPCSRTAPCKTFAGAISKTAAGGEINCLDPGGFGAVTITKAMTIDCHYTEGGNLAGGNGIVVNALSTDVVVIRGLDIFGVNPPTNGIRVISAAAVHVEDCVIRRFNAANSFGISFQPSALARLYVVNTTITQNGNGTSGGGILVQPTGTGAAQVMIEDTRVQQNSGQGLSLDTTGNTGGGIAIAVKNSQFVGTSGNGISLLSPGGVAISAMITDSVSAHNSGAGIVANGASATARVGNTSIFGNAFAGGIVSGVLLLNSGKVQTYGDNRLDANAVDGAFTSPAIPKK